MIIEHIRKKHGGDSFKKLAAYITNAPDSGKGRATDWKLAAYVMDTPHAGEKVGMIRITNCQSTDPGWAVAECAALSLMNTRSKADRSVHLVVSFPEGEKPTPDQLADIEAEVVKSIGFQDHKRISATHVNTENFHLHIAICAVHPVTHNLRTPYYSHYRLQEAAVALEIRHGLNRTNHDPGRKGRPTERERANLGMWIEQNAAGPIIKAAANARTWEDLHRAMAQHGLVIKPRGAGLVIAHYKDARSMVKASSVDRSLSASALTKRLGAYEPPDALGITPTQQYTPGARLPEAETLWTKYQAEREAALAARQVALQTLKIRHTAYAAALSAWYDRRYAAAREQRLARADRMATRRTLATEAKQDRAERLTRDKAERDATRAAHAVPNWQGFLAREAAAGDPVAAQSLQRSLGKGPDTPVPFARSQASVLAEQQRLIRENIMRQTRHAGRGLSR